MRSEILTVEDIYQAEKLVAETGVLGEQLMEAAGFGAVVQICERWTKQPVVVLCGPGSNGGDGFVIARHLHLRGWPVKVALYGSVDELSGLPALNAQRWQSRCNGKILPLEESVLDGLKPSRGLVVDALFGAGLTRPLEDEARDVIDVVNMEELACVAIDMPSGVAGDSGRILGGCAPACDLTVTFFRPKPGHLLCPGRTFCGEITVLDIGIHDWVIDRIAPVLAVNEPDLWDLPFPGPHSHKYNRGHVLMRGGFPMTGAIRLAGIGARRIGAGLVTISVPTEAVIKVGSSSPGTIVTPDDYESFEKLIEDERKNVCLIGPGNNVNEETCKRVLYALKNHRACVLDADAITCFTDNPQVLFDAIETPVVLTPHMGEFERLFPEIAGNNAMTKWQMAIAAAEKSNAVIILKGADTVIAEPHGMAAINVNAPSWLATGGTGDVLAGMIAGLMAQGMGVFEAACAGVWIHAEAARTAGVGMIAEDLPNCIPKVMEKIIQKQL